MPARIEDHGVIGDLHTVALVATDATIDFLSFPHFDSPTVFAALLDDERGGHFAIAPVLDGVTTKQLYLPDTAVLLTRFLSDEGVAEVSDFMPVEEVGHGHHLVRRAKTVRGKVRFHMRCEPRFEYGRAEHIARVEGRTVVFASRGSGRRMLRLHGDVPLRVVDGVAVAEFDLGEKETAAFVLEDARPGIDSPAGLGPYVPESFKRTVNFWRGWLGRCNYRGRWREIVCRSAITLKLLTSRMHGSLVAAPTFGLPEEIGSERNWDYRYTWIRDASFTLYALLTLGFTEEAEAFMDWIEARCRESEADPPLQVMYGIDGRRELPEEELDHLAGYLGSRPVRIGNAAYRQLQLDVYGELLDSVYLYEKYAEPISHQFWGELRRIVDWVCENWRRPDEGIWEVRGGAREFLYSRVMCWVAVDRAIRLCTKRSLPAPVERWRRVRDEIYDEVHARFWNEERRAFVQFPGSDALDAASLLMPLVKFISPRDPRWLATLRAIEEDLVEDSLVFRYRPEHAAADGLPGGEGTFSMCSFWYVECLARAGDVEKARLFFEKMLGYANHVGLFSEELGPRGEHLGNFPQALTHLALISAAVNLDRRLG